MTGMRLSQLVLDLAHRPALGAEDFLVSRSNEAAAEMIDRWPDWPHPRVRGGRAAGRGQDAISPTCGA